ncbi:MAG: hypothetical protein LBU32_18735 [Clostridiales bacterium]|jgi:hypothetical protein|nr:hypothetical protein [Clostridiales bacterium]
MAIKREKAAFSHGCGQNPGVCGHAGYARRFAALIGFLLFDAVLIGFAAFAAFAALFAF